MAHDVTEKSDAELIRMAEQPDNPKRTSLYAEEMEDAERELGRRGYSASEISDISVGKYNPRRRR